MSQFRDPLRWEKKSKLVPYIALLIKRLRLKHNNKHIVSPTHIKRKKKR
jgi:hypothetical protein